MGAQRAMKGLKMKIVSYPAFVEVEFGTYASGRDATLAQWRAQKRLAKDGGRADDDRRIINHLVNSVISSASGRRAADSAIA
jgi:hypothetical protein